MGKEARRKVDYGKISGAISGRSLAMVDPTIALKRKAQKDKVDREFEKAIGQSVLAGTSLMTAVGKNLDTWSELKTGAIAVGGKEAGAFDFSGGGARGLLRRMFSAAPAGGQLRVKGKVFSGTELSGIGKAVQGGYGQTITPKGSSLFDAYGATLKKAGAGSSWTRSGGGLVSGEHILLVQLYLS